MASDLAVETEKAEIISFRTKTATHSENYNIEDGCTQAIMELNSNRSDTSFKEKLTTEREAVNSATEITNAFKEINSTANPTMNPTQSHYRKNFGKKGMYVSPASLWNNPSNNTHLSYNEYYKQENIRSLKRAELMKTAALESQLKEDRTAENEVPFDQANDDNLTREQIGNKTMLKRAILGGSTGNHPGSPGDCNKRDPKPPDLEDSANSPVSTKFEEIWTSSPDRSSSKPHIYRSNGDEENDQSTQRSEVMESENFDLIANRGRFVFPPPKFSHPYSTVINYKETSQSSAFEKAGKTFTLPSSMLTPSQQQENNANKQHANEKDITSIGNGRPDIAVHKLGTTDDDSIFMFHEKSDKICEHDHVERICENGEKKMIKIGKVTSKVRRRTRRKQRSLVENVCTDDEMSMENYGAISAVQSTGLQARSHQAWKSRQRKNSTVRSKCDNKTRIEKLSNVSFRISDTIHHFEPDVVHRQQYTKAEEEDISLDRSLNSEYTKTLESEVEDMIKDILFIGSPQKSKPGRRKYRYKPEIERKLGNDRISNGTMTGSKINKSEQLFDQHKTKIKDTKDLSSDMRSQKCELRNILKYSSAKELQHQSKYEAPSREDDRSLASTLSRGSSVGSNTIETFQSEKDTTGDPLNTVIGFVEGGLSVMTSAIGYAFGDQTTEEYEATTERCQKSASDFDIFESCGIPVGEEKDRTKTTDNMFTQATGVFSEGLWVNGTGSADCPKNMIRHSEKAKRKFDIQKDQGRDKSLMTDIEHDLARRSSNLGHESELIRLATYAARSVHKLQGVDYDESVAIDMQKEVKKSHVTLELPLGIIFLENDGGCFVTKVSPDGSAARSRGVEVGDQLASINGTSSIKMKVDDICDAISRSTDPGQIKLVFLRYIGPFRPCTKAIVSKDVCVEIHDVKCNDRTSNISLNKNPNKKVTGFRLFGKGKKNNSKNTVKDTTGGIP